jgi:hypothetical protein
MTWDGPRYFDEYGHWRHVNDIVRSRHLFVPTPYLPIQRDYPGLEALTAALHAVTRLPTWHVGQIVVLVAHCAVLVAIWRIAKLLDLSNRAAVVAAVIYSLNPSFLYFDTQFSYESLGLPLCFIAIALSIGARRASTARGAWGLASLASASAVACAVVHHTSTIVMVPTLVVVAAAVPRRVAGAASAATRWSSWVVAVVAAGFATIWLLAVAGSTYGYLEPHIHAGATDALNFVRGRTTRTFDNGGVIETRRTLFSGSQLPVYEIICAFFAVPLVLAGVGAALAEHRRDRRELARRIRLLAPFYALVALYLVSFPIALTATGGETAHRAWAFGYAGVALVVASAEGQWDRLTARLTGRRLVTVGAVALLVVAIGNTAAGENLYYRFPGPTTFATDTRSRSDELDALASWARANLPAGSKVVTDRFTGEAVIGYTQLRVPEPSDYLVYRLYREGGMPTPRLRDYLRQHRFRYFILDRRIGVEEPVQKLFPGYIGSRSVSRFALASVGRTPFLRVVHRTATYDVLRIDA